MHYKNSSLALYTAPLEIVCSECAKETQIFRVLGGRIRPGELVHARMLSLNTQLKH